MSIDIGDGTVIETYYEIDTDSSVIKIYYPYGTTPDLGEVVRELYRMERDGELVH